MFVKRQNYFLFLCLVLLSLLGLLRLFYSARVQVVSGPLVEVEPEECVRTKQFEGGEKEGATLLILNVILPTGVSTIVCIKPTESGDSQNLSDNVISKSIRDTGAWEGFNVNNVVRAVNRFPEATFLGNSLDQNVTFNPLHRRGLQHRDVLPGGGGHGQAGGRGGRRRQEPGAGEEVRGVDQQTVQHQADLQLCE